MNRYEFPPLTLNTQLSINLRRTALPLCVLGFLWFTLINHLRIEWTVNPQYGYGWAVPFLCAFLIWKNVAHRPSPIAPTSTELRSADFSPLPRRPGESAGGGLKSALLLAPRPAPRAPPPSPIAPTSSELRSADFSPLPCRPGESAGGGLKSALLAPRLSPFFICLALAWLPTRLIQEANPEWRLVSWALAIEVVGLTLFIGNWVVGSLELGGRSMASGQSSDVKNQTSEVGGPTGSTEVGGQRSQVRISDFLFPLCFFLIAVPWPTLIEAPLIQFLTRTNAAATVEVVGWFGIPALLRGNIIEVGTGMVGIDDACSGIRSFQATLMLSLFLGDFFWLTVRRRLMLVLGGCLLACVFNVARTSALVWIASGKGVAAMSVWHDPAGVTILVADFICLGLAAMAMRRTGFQPAGAGGVSAAVPTLAYQGQSRTARLAFLGSEGEGAGSESGVPTDSETTGQHDSKAAGPRSVLRGRAHVDTAAGAPDSGTAALREPEPETPCRGPALRHTILPLVAVSRCVLRGPWSLLALAAWFVLVEAGTELWYRSHEALLAKTVPWTVEFPRDNPTFRTVPFSDITKQFLRYDEGLNGVWIDAGARVQAIFLRWNPGRIAPHLAKSHTPEVCLTAAGHEIISQSDSHKVTAHGLQMPFRSYVVKDEHGPVHVFYCLWEDRADEQTFSTTHMSYANRLAPVLAGRRNSGQRSLEIALWGMGDSTEADAALARELEKLIKIQN